MEDDCAAGQGVGGGMGPLFKPDWDPGAVLVCLNPLNYLTGVVLIITESITLDWLSRTRA